MKKRIVIEDPEASFDSEVVPSGNGAVVKAYKRYIGRKATVVVKGETK
jgi:putative transposon-encoded protein